MLIVFHIIYGFVIFFSSDGYQLPSSLDLLLGSQPDPNNMNHRGKLLIYVLNYFYVLYN